MSMEKIFSGVENEEQIGVKKIKNWPRNIFKNIVEEKIKGKTDIQ